MSIGTCSYVNSEITRFFLTEWDDTIVSIYTSNNVINHYEWITKEWYEIKIDTARMTYAQEMSTNNANGIYYNEIININIPKAENSKWIQLVDLLYTKKYIIVFKDANEHWFTAGYRWGTEVKTYQLAENQYIISFISPHANNLPTLIEENFVINSIINLPTPSVTPSITPSISLTPTPTPSCVPAFILEILFPTNTATDTSILVRTTCTAIGGTPLLVRQIYYSKTSNPPTNADSIINVPLVYGTIDTVITGLQPGTGYYFCTYAENSCGADGLCYPNLYYTLAGPTPSVSPTISITPSITPSLSISASITPTISVSRTPTPTHTPPSSPSPSPLPYGFGIHTSHTYTSAATCCSDAYSPETTVYLIHPDTVPSIGDFFYTNVGCTNGFMGTDKYYHVRRYTDRWAVKISSSGTGYIQDVVICI